MYSPLLYYHVRENSTSSGVSGFPIRGSFLSSELSTAISSSVSVKSNNAKFSRICSGFALLGMIAIFFWVRKRKTRQSIWMRKWHIMKQFSQDLHPMTPIRKNGRVRIARNMKKRRSENAWRSSVNEDIAVICRY